MRAVGPISGALAPAEGRCASAVVTVDDYWAFAQNYVKFAFVFDFSAVVTICHFVDVYNHFFLSFCLSPPPPLDLGFYRFRYVHQERGGGEVLIASFPFLRNCDLFGFVLGTQPLCRSFRFW